MQEFFPDERSEISPDPPAAFDTLGADIGDDEIPIGPPPVPEQETVTARPVPDPPKNERSNSGQVLVRLVWLLSVLIILLVLKNVVPDMAEQYYYATTRGKLRAEYETAGEALKADPLRDLTLASQKVSHRVAPSVVHIQTRDLDSASPPTNDPQPHMPWRREAMGQGSGVIVDQEGYVMTNWHVVRGSDAILRDVQRQEARLRRRLTNDEMVGMLNERQEIKVTLSDKRVTEARIVGYDNPTDVAVLLVAADQLMPAEWGSSAELEVGSLVWAVGSPFGLQQSITSGILSAKNRAEKAGTAYQDFLQTDAAVNPGNSGGPLVDHRGRIVGINTAIVGDTYQGISFAIPSDVARNVYNRIRSDGHVSRGWLGIEMRDVNEETAAELKLPNTDGCFVERVVGDTNSPSPAFLAGVKVGDVVVRWNDEVIDSATTLKRVVGATEIGSRAKVELIRAGHKVVVELEVGERPPID